MPVKTAAAPTKTEQRRATIQRGSTSGATLGERALSKSAIAEQRRVISGDHVDTAAADSRDIQRRRAARESMAADEYREPNSAAAETWRLDVYDDPRYVPLTHLLSDLRRRVKLQTRGFSKDERGDIATDAALLLAKWTKQGASAPIYLGPRGSLPLRRVWFDSDKRTVIRDGASTRPAPSERAERAMRAAIHQVVRDRNADHDAAVAARAADVETVSADDERNGATLAAAALASEQRTAELAPLLPDTDEPDLVAGAMGISLTAARAILARGWHMSPRVCGEQWGVSKSNAENILSIGAAEVRKRWPDSADLLSALAAAAPVLREQLATRAYWRLTELRDAPAWADGARLMTRAETAVNEWRTAMGEVPMARRAIELAAHRVGWAPENISATDYLLRLLTAEQRRASATAASSARSSHLAGASIDPAGASNDWEQRQQRAPLKRQAGVRSMLTPAARRWSYGLEAATARQIAATDATLAAAMATIAAAAETIRDSLGASAEH